MVGITVVSDDDDFIASGAGCLNRVMYTAIYGLYGLADSIIDSRMAYHVSVGIINHDEVVFVLADGSN